MTSDSGLEWQPLTYIEPEAYHIMVSKQYPHGAELLQLLNQGITEALPTLKPQSA